MVALLVVTVIEAAAVVPSIRSRPSPEISARFLWLVDAPPALIKVRRPWTVWVAAVVKTTVLVVPSLMVMVSAVAKPKEAKVVVVVKLMAVPVSTEVVGALASAWLSDPWAVWRRLVRLVMPLLAASIVLCPRLIVSSRELRVLMLVWKAVRQEEVGRIVERGVDPLAGGKLVLDRVHCVGGVLEGKEVCENALRKRYGKSHHS